MQLPTARLVWVLQAVVPAAQLQPGGIELREVGAVAKAPSNTQDIAPRGTPLDRAGRQGQITRVAWSGTPMMASWVGSTVTAPNEGDGGAPSGEPERPAGAAAHAAGTNGRRRDEKGEAKPRLGAAAAAVQPCPCCGLGRAAAIELDAEGTAPGARGRQCYRVATVRARAESWR